MESFDGRGNHISTENWLNDVEELLVTTRCTNEQKVVYTTYKLIEEAKYWWQDKKVLLVTGMGSKTAITWDIFKHEFNRHLFPRVIQKVKA